MNNHQRKKSSSLRELARKLECSHSSLSEQIHRGELTRGVAIKNGRAVVTDIAAAAAEWNGRPARDGADVIMLDDPTMGCCVSALALFEERDALALLASALTAHALAQHNVDGLTKRIEVRLREVASLHGAEQGEIRRAKDQLRLAIELVTYEEDDAEDEP